MMIPKIIHYCWFTKNGYMPDRIKKYIESWKKVLPDYKLMLWDERNFNLNICAYARQAYDAGKYAFVADVARVEVLLKHGGVYLDADVEILSPLDDLLENKLFFGMENIGRIGTAIIGCEKGDEYLKHISSLYKGREFVREDGTLDSTSSNDFFQAALIDKGVKIGISNEKIHFYEKSVLYPHNDASIKDYSKTIHNLTASYLPLVSVIIPTYNCGKYIKEAIASVLDQGIQSMEVLILDDGSTDDTRDIIAQIKDHRVIYIPLKKEGLVAALNYGMRRAMGQYMVRMDADDVMMKGRITKQVNYLETNKNIDIVCGGMHFWKDDKIIGTFSYNGEITLASLSGGTRVAHATVCMRRQPMIDNFLYYDKSYELAEDYKLWVDVLEKGLRIISLPEPVLLYRRHGNNSTIVHYEKMQTVSKNIQHYLNDKLMNEELTVIIPFRNEGCEVEKTVKSIRETADNVDIILINDGSNDRWNYRSVAHKYNCRYLAFINSKGVAESRETGVKHCWGEYFVFVDAHMRFYDKGWDRKLIESLRKDDNCIICSNSAAIKKSGDEYVNEDGKTRINACGCRLNVEKPGEELSISWVIKKTDKEVVEIPVIMGAVYAMSKRWYEYIGGLQGLRGYGLDEQFLSLKSWMCGGRCLLFTTWYVGHIYRKKFPYTVIAKETIHNKIFILETLVENSETYLNNLKLKIGKTCYNRAMELYKPNRFVLPMKHSFEWFINEINAKSHPRY